MSSTDDRIVRMQFDNAQFKKGAEDTKKSLADLDKATQNTGKSKGLLDLNSNMERVSVTASKMAVVTTTALATIANKATNVALGLASSLTLDPIKSGFSEYESLLTKQNVIMNATGKSAAVVKGVLNDLNHYSDKTIFSFGDMTEGMTSFVNAGVPLKQAAQAMKGIANASALAGASTQEAQSSFRAFGQAMGNGFLGLQDFRQASITGKIGTVAFKQSLIDAAVEVGTLTKRGKDYVTSNGKVLSATKNFDNSLQEQWASAKVLNKALGEYANEQSAMGKKAFKAAQDVRTFSAFMDTLKESLGSGWSGIFTNLFGGLEDSTKLWTGLSNAVGKVVNSFFNWINVSLSTWRSMGGFTKTVDALKNVLSPIGAIFGTISKAMKAAFPSSGEGAGKGLYAFSSALELLTRPLRLVAWLIEQLAGPLTLVFKLIKIGGAAIRAFVGSIIDLVEGAVGLVDIKIPTGDGGFLGWLKKMGAALVAPINKISELLDKGKSLKEAFSSIDIKLPSLPGLPSLPSLPSLGGGEKLSDGASKGAAGLEKSKVVLKNLAQVLKTVSSAIKSFMSSLLPTGDQVGSVFGKIGDVIAKVGAGIKFVFEKIDWEKVLASFNIAVFSTFLITLSRLMDTVRKGIDGVAGFGEASTALLEKTGNAMKSFQTQANAKLILNIGIALLLLAGALWIMSKIPVDKLVTSLFAMGVLMKIMSMSMEAMTKAVEALDGKKTGFKMIALGASMILFAIAVSILAGALKKMNDVDFDAVIKGGLAINILTVAMKVLAGLDKEGIIQAGAALVLVSIALLVFAKAVKAFAALDFKTFAEGMTYAAISLAVLRVTMQGFQSSLAGAAALVVVMFALTEMVGVIALFSKLKPDTFADGIKRIALSLVVLVIAMQGFQSSLVGAAALVVAVGALYALVGVIALFSKMDWGAFFKGLGMMSIAFVVLGALMALMGVFSPLILLGAAALLVFGAAMFLLGAGILFLAKGMVALIAIGAGISAFFISLAVGFTAFLQTLANEAPLMKESFLKILQTLIDTVVEAVPMVIDGVKRLWKAIKAEFASDDKKKDTGEAGKSWIEKLKEGIIEKIPAIVEAAADILVKFIQGLGSKAKDLAKAAANLVVKLVEGLGSHAAKLAGAAVDLIIKLAEGVEKNAFKLVNAGISLIATFLHDLASAIRNGSKAIGGGLTDVFDAMKDVGVNMVKGLIQGVTDFADDALGAIGGLAKSMIGKATGIFDINSPSKVFYAIGSFLVSGLTAGIQNNAASAISAVASMVSGQIAVANEYVSGFIQSLDQQAIAARAKADGLAAAAQQAENAAKMTKGKKDDRAAANLQKQADAAAKQADAAESTAESAKARQDRADEMEKASTIDKARMRSEDAQNDLDAAKAAEQRAAAARTQAAALEKQSRARGVSAAERRKLQAEANAARRYASAQATLANQYLDSARTAASDALRLQKQAGEEAAKSFQAAFEADAKAAADEEAYEKLSNSEKAEKRRQQAVELQQKAEEDLAKAKTLAYTDIEAANNLAAVAMQEAEQARQYLKDAEDLSKSSNTASGGGVLGTVVNLQPTEDAAVRMRDYEDTYNSGVAAAAGGTTLEFNQYNTSPEALSPTEIYRNTNNQLTKAVDKIDEFTA